MQGSVYIDGVLQDCTIESWNPGVIDHNTAMFVPSRAITVEVPPESTWWHLSKADNRKARKARKRQRQAKKAGR